MRQIGLHIRVAQSIIEAAHYAEELSMPIFQSFLLNQSDRKPLSIDSQIAHHFKEVTSGKKFYVHGSYWINLAQSKQHGLNTLKKEIALAKKLGATHIVFHPGAASAGVSRKEGIEAVAQAVNSIVKQEKTITILLENTVHARNTIGSDIEDFYHIKKLIDEPERIGFCIDTAHAHAYGYNLASMSGQHKFIDLIDATVGLNTVQLIHLNDAEHQLASRIDKHAPIGHGTIGERALKTFVMDPRLVHIPLILEMPILSTEVDNDMLQKVRSWHTE